MSKASRVALLIMVLGGCTPSEAMHVRISAGDATEEVIRENLAVASDVLGVEIVETDREWGSVEIYYREPTANWAGVEHPPNPWDAKDWCKRRVGVGFDPVVLAHELGHAFELEHTDAGLTANVMVPRYEDQRVEELWLSDEQWEDLVVNVARFNLRCAR